MVKSKFSLWYILIIIFVILIIVGAYKNLSNHQKKEIDVVNNKILESATKCYLKGDCTDEIKLKDLYDKEYLETIIDPITKENMDENLCIKFDEGKAIFCK